MSVVDHLQTLARYGAWANRRLYAACAELEPAAYMAERGAFFGSIHRTLNHILVADRIWLGRIEGVDAGIPTLDTVLYDDLDSLTEARVAEDARIIACADGLSPADVETTLHYRNMAGEQMSTPLALVMVHLINHATHHRGQVHCMISQVPADPPVLDLPYFLRETG